MLVTIDEAIRTLSGADRYLFNDNFSNAIESAIEYLKEMSEKPSLDANVYSIKYYTNGIEKWGYYRHEKTHESIQYMPIRTLLELAKNGGLDNDKFTSIYSNSARRLNKEYVTSIKYMLIHNGYATREELYKNATRN